MAYSPAGTAKKISPSPEHVCAMRACCTGRKPLKMELNDGNKTRSGLKSSTSSGPCKYTIVRIAEKAGYGLPELCLRMNLRPGKPLR